MLKKLAVFSNSALLCLLLSACGSATVGIDLTGGGNSSGSQIDTTTLILIVLGAVIIIGLAFIFTRKR